MNSLGGMLGEGKVVLEREGKKISEYLDINGLAGINVPPATYLLKIDLNNKEIAKQNIDIKGDKDVNIISSLLQLISLAMISLASSSNSEAFLPNKCKEEGLP